MSAIHRSRAASLRAVLCLASLFTLAGCRGSSPPAHHGLFPVRLQADWYPQPEQGGFYTALIKGYYRQEGLDVSILPLGQYGSGLQVVASGAAEFGLGSSDQILESVANGLPLIAVGATMQHDPQALMVHADSPVHDFAELDGHTIAAQPGSVWFQYIVHKYQLKNVREVPATHSVANFLADPNYIQQIFVTSEPFFVAKAGGQCRTLLISSTGYDPYRVFFTRRDFLAQHPVAVAGFVRATIRGWREYLRDPAPTNALILKLNPAQNPEQMNYTVKALKDGKFITGDDATGAPIGQMTAERWAENNQQLVQLGVIQHPIDPNSAYTLRFLPQ